MYRLEPLCGVESSHLQVCLYYNAAVRRLSIVRLVLVAGQ